MSIIKSNKPSFASLKDATGTIDFKMTNDYMFRAILQRHNNVLKGLVCSLLHLKPKEVSDITITNPIELGENINSKEFILDITVCINNKALINLDMQVVNELNWDNRSLSYLCRTFDQLYQGQDYNDAKAVVHVGFLDFQPFPDIQRFYSTYQLVNTQNMHLYTSNFTLSMIDLTHIELATEEDRAYHIDYWAKLFKAGTWEELRMLAEKNEYIKEATEAIYKINADELERQKCRARDDYNKLHRTIERDMKRYIAERDQALETIRERDAEIASKEEEIARLQTLLAEREK